MTVVTKYYQNENIALIYDNDAIDEYKALIQELNITPVEPKEANPITFTRIDKSLEDTITQLCPSKVEYTQYKFSTIPLEVLQAIKMCINNKYFDTINIYYTKEQKDPFVVGVVATDFFVTDSNNKQLKRSIGKDEYTWWPRDLAFQKLKEDPTVTLKPCEWASDAKFLIARWGDENLTLDELRAKAAKSYVQSHSLELKKKINEAKRELEDIELESLVKFGVIAS